MPVMLFATCCATELTASRAERMISWVKLAIARRSLRPGAGADPDGLVDAAHDLQTGQEPVVLLGFAARRREPAEDDRPARPNGAQPVEPGEDLLDLRVEELHRAGH